MRKIINFLSISFLIILFLIDPLQAEIKLFCDQTDSLRVMGVLEIPEGEGSNPAVIILHGSGGLDQRYARLAKSFSDSGFVALALDYYADAGSSPAGSEEKLNKWSQYQKAVYNAVEYLRSLPNVSDQPVGLVGFSRGGFLAVSVAASIPSVKAVVDFFGGGGGGTEPIENEVEGMPPLLILHGENDSIVSVKYAHELQQAIIQVGGEVEMHIYLDEGHGLSAATLPDAFRRAVVFLKRHLIVR